MIVDAGHGGEDGGASTADGVPESQLNLAIALRLEQVLALCGCPVEMIRRTDTAVYSDGAETFSEKRPPISKPGGQGQCRAPGHFNQHPSKPFYPVPVCRRAGVYAASEGSRDLAELTPGYAAAGTGPG